MNLALLNNINQESYKVSIIIDSTYLKDFIIERIKTSDPMGYIITNAIITYLTHTISNFKAEYYNINPTNLAMLLKNGFILRYLTIVFDVSKNINDFALPNFIQLNNQEITVTNNPIVEAIIKKKELKTKTKFYIEISNQLIPKTFFNQILYHIASLEHNCYDFLQDCKPEIYEWWIQFECKICGYRYFCDCFNKALNIHDAAIDITSTRSMNLSFMEAFKNKSFLKNICHLCTTKTPIYDFCHQMYGSAFK